MDPISALIPHRELYWNVVEFFRIVVYPLLLLVVAALAYAGYRHRGVVLKGKPENRFDRIGERLAGTLRVLFTHSRIVRPWELYNGITHFFIFSGFVVLTIATGLVMLQADLTEPLFGWLFLQGPFYIGFKLFANLFGLLFLVGIAMAVIRRYAVKPGHLHSIADDGLILFWAAVLGVGGFLVQTLRLADSDGVVNGAFLWYHFVSAPFALVLRPLGDETLRLLHMAAWRFHMVTSMGFLAYIAVSKLSHIFLSTANVFFRPLGTKGALAPIPNIEEQETFGVSKLTDFTWKQLLSADACMRCGRCLEFCPTYNTGKVLKPKHLIQELAGYMADHGDLFPGLLGKEQADGAYRWGKGVGRQLIGEVISEDEIWDCTTCRACMEQCPVYIEHVPMIIDLRRHLVLEQSSFPAELTSTFNNMERTGSPWQFPRNTRADWAKGMGIPTLAQTSVDEIDLLYWVGCMGSFDERNKKVSKAFARVMQHVGVKFAILGREEQCTGDSARRCGNEYLFQTLAQANVELLNGYGVKKIVTTCAHCLNTLRNEYPQLGGSYEVIHHSQLIARLIAEGKVKLPTSLNGRKKMTYHDPCYIGRYNDIFEEPRSVVGALPGADLVEMRMNQKTSFCCGAGGGRGFMEEKRGSRINQHRTKQALETGAQVVATACPFCMTMFEDGRRGINAEEQIQPLDIAELVAQAIEGTK
ncbi:MAG: 4Fe-4S dicluster domain-containing protein [Chloroflexi bacterium]|nr:4Fe-4S dicluster domain-containing protein [Chloroflexota bacterium]